jgi:leucyl/phenylalanyl-tRNA---protein transferase
MLSSNAIEENELLHAYMNGFFPMAHPEEANKIYWHKPEMRGIIPLNEFKVSKNLSRLYRNGKFQFRVNGNFEAVIEACASRSETWISEDIIESYVNLNKLGYAYSFEVWLENKLVGGLYGIAIGKAFFGESMFHKISNASKLALVFLVENLVFKGFTLLDTQYLNDHIKQFGAIEIPAEEYEKKLEEAIASV